MYQDPCNRMKVKEVNWFSTMNVYLFKFCRWISSTTCQHFHNFWQWFSRWIYVLSFTSWYLEIVDDYQHLQHTRPADGCKYMYLLHCYHTCTFLVKPPPPVVSHSGTSTNYNLLARSFVQGNPFINGIYTLIMHSM